MSELVARSVGAPLAGVPALRPGRLGLPIAVAIVLHVALLAWRPGGLSSDVAAVSRTMIVRMLQPAPTREANDAVAGDAVRTAAAPAAAIADPPRSEVDTPKVLRPSSSRGAVHTAPSGEHSPGHERPRADAASTTSAAAVPANPGGAAAEKTLPAAPGYALGIRLDPGPRPIDAIEPEYPEAGQLREGTVVLRLLISETGHVDDVAVVRSEPKTVFDQAAVDAFAKARFEPGMAAGLPVKSQITVEVQFMPINRGSRVSGRTY